MQKTRSGAGGVDGSLVVALSVSLVLVTCAAAGGYLVWARFICDGRVSGGGAKPPMSPKSAPTSPVGSVAQSSADSPCVASPPASPNLSGRAPKDGPAASLRKAQAQPDTVSPSRVLSTPPALSAPRVTGSDGPTASRCGFQSVPSHSSESTYSAWEQVEAGPSPHSEHTADERSTRSRGDHRRRGAVRRIPSPELHNALPCLGQWDTVDQSPGHQPSTLTDSQLRLLDLVWTPTPPQPSPSPEEWSKAGGGASPPHPSRGDVDGGAGGNVAWMRLYQQQQHTPAPAVVSDAAAALLARASMMLGLGSSASSTSAGHDNSDSRREGLECRGRREHRQSVGATHSMAMSCSFGNGTYLRLTCPVKLIIMLYRVNNNSYAEPRPCVHG